MLNNLLRNARQQAGDRLSSPILGSFAVAWCLFNYKFLVILFSAESVKNTFNLIETLVFPDEFNILMRGILLPAASTMVYIFLYPYPARFVFGFAQRRRREVNQLRQKIEDETLISVEESRSVRSQLIAIEATYHQEVDRLNEEISRLRAMLKSAAESTVNQYNIDTTSEASHEPDLTPGQVKLMGALYRLNGQGAFARLRLEVNQPVIEMEFNIGELERMNLVEKSTGETDEVLYSFTHEGRRTAIRLHRTFSINTAV